MWNPKNLPSGVSNLPPSRKYNTKLQSVQDELGNWEAKQSNLSKPPKKSLKFITQLGLKLFKWPIELGAWFLYRFLNLEHEPEKISYARICIRALAFGSCSDKSLVIAHIWLFKQWILKNTKMQCTAWWGRISFQLPETNKGETVRGRELQPKHENVFHTKNGWGVLRGFNCLSADKTELLSQ